MHNPIGFGSKNHPPQTPGLPWGRENRTFLGSFGGFLPEIPVFCGALTAFRDFIHRFPRRCRFSSWLGANLTWQSMETTSELLWFCKGKCGIVAGKGGKIPPGFIPGTPSCVPKSPHPLHFLRNFHPELSRFCRVLCCSFPPRFPLGKKNDPDLCELEDPLAPQGFIHSGRKEKY